MSKQTGAMKLALEKALSLLIDNREYIEANERAAYLEVYDNAIAEAEKALAEQQEPAQLKPANEFTDEQLNAVRKSVSGALADAFANLTNGQIREMIIDPLREINEAKGVKGGV